MRVLDIIALVGALSALDCAAGAMLLEIDPQLSKIEVAVSCNVDSFMGRLEKYQAAIECDPAGALPTKADLSFDFADLKTGNKDRDAAMCKWLEYDSNPSASFSLTGWNQAGTTNIALGNMKIHGITMAVKMPVVVTHHDADWDIAGELAFDYRDFKLKKIRKALVLTVDPKLKVTFHLVGKAVAGK